MATHQLSINYTSPTGTKVIAATATGEANFELDETIAAAASNQSIAGVTIPVTGLQAVLLYATAAMTVYTNAASGGSPDQTFTLAAGTPIYWTYGNGSNPITTAITSLYVTSTPGGTLSVRALFNT